MILVATLLLILSSCHSDVISRHDGIASYYADKFHDQRTASGELYDTSKYTAAHRDLPFGQQLRIIRRDDGRSVIVTVNDRGPFNKRRIVDLSKAAARDLGMLHQGILKVTVEVIE
ncbi:MAG: septal ring lytic transglycosylase RlpA family protein [Saprospiraceae bacterium]|nr:septal ring lytic transglycosylase RlpA family protein [Saprospiraceae bacterium]